MIDFNNFKINRLIIHTILSKSNNQDSATCVESNEIIPIDDRAIDIIKQRLIDAAGKNSKAFELEIENTTPGSFFQLSNDVMFQNNEMFIGRTKNIARILSQSQRSSSIPGGYLLFLDCKDIVTNFPIIIVIKAEPHDALQYSERFGINVLDKVFLSPSQKLFKIGILYKKNNEVSDNINYHFGCFLYDDQFRTESHPAEYFYKDFLGFSVGNNAKIQSQRFYDKTKDFILNNVIDLDLKASLLSALKNEFNINQNDTINPIYFASTFMPNENDIRDLYIANVCQEMPHSIVKDSTLIKTRISKRKINFPKKISIEGPEESFDTRVKIIHNYDDLNTENFNSSVYTFLRISGKPYTTNE